MLSRTSICARGPLIFLHSRGVKTTAEIRENFLQFFERNAHKRLPSSDLIPANDPTLLFTNAGMVQFKDIMCGKVSSPFSRATTAQKCLRAGGKHNDLDNVGFTNRHHTFFEMLGNFSFGDYSKEQAIEFAWRYVTEELSLPVSRLLITVHHCDDEAAVLWKKISGLPDAAIVRKGDEDNFWSMGESGPCGYCSEIYFDQLQEVDGERYLEIWNLVFMSFNRVNGVLLPLAKPCIDTGMGLERIASVLQGVKSNYEIDLMQSLMQSARDLVVSITVPSPQNSVLHSPNCDFSVVNPQIVALRVMVDHLRACAFLISEGVIPGANGRSYVLRRILRRAVRYASCLGVSIPCLSALVDPLVVLMGDAYPQLRASQQVIKHVIANEESLFFVTFEKGSRFLHDSLGCLAAACKVLPGQICFTMQTEYGFPLDLTELVARDAGYAVDAPEFSRLLEAHKELSRQTAKFGTVPADHIPDAVLEWKQAGIFPVFSGYCADHLTQETKVLAVSPVDAEGFVWVSVSPCPFYPEGGGQVGDVGELRSAEFHGKVVKTVRPYPEGIAMRVSDPEGELKVGALVLACVDETVRRRASSHHTGTHLLNAALRATLSNTITQAGSLVDPHRLRFDFAYRPKIGPAEIQKLERWINERCLKHLKALVTATEMPREKALQTDAIMLLGEKYADVVRVVTVGDKISTELCGGTHATDLSQIYPFKIISVTAVSAGTKRIEAVCGQAASEMLLNHSAVVFDIANLLRVSHDEVENAVNQLFKRSKAQRAELEKGDKQAADTKSKHSASTATVLKCHTKEVAGEQVCFHLVDMDSPDTQTLRAFGDGLLAQLPGCHVVVCGCNVLAVVDLRVKRYQNFSGADGLLKFVLPDAEVSRSGGKYAFANKVDATNLLFDSN